MAIRGQAPTVLLLVSEPMSELGSGNGGAVFQGKSDSIKKNIKPTEDSGENNISGGEDSRGNLDDADASGDGDGVCEDSGSGGRPNGGTAAPLSSVSASAPTIEPNAAGAAPTAGGSVTTAETTGKASTGKDKGTAPYPEPSSLIRFPHHQSQFCVPSLADIDEFSEGSNADSRGVAINVSSNSSLSGQGGGTTRESVHRSFAVSEGHTWDSKEHTRDGISGDRSKLRGQESNERKEDGASAWEGLLDVNVCCLGSGNYPLHEAAASGSVGAVLSLSDLGANMSVVNGCGDTALHVR